MVNIIKMMAPPKFIGSKTSGLGNTCQFIVVHETANANKGANANAHARLQFYGNSRDASWHYQVDDKEIIQSFDDKIRCWHAGSANFRSISIEICVNNDGNFSKAVDNAVQLVKHLMSKHNIPIDRVKQHNYFTGKNCPTNLRNGSKGVNWSQFISKVKANQVTPSKPSTNPTPSTSPGQIGIVEILVPSLNVRSSDNLSAKIVKTVKKGQKYKTYKLSNGMYNLGGNQWVSAGKAYTKFTPVTQSIPSIHKVIKGDTLWSLSQKYKTSVNELKKLNNLKSDVLSIGQSIKYK